MLRGGLDDLVAFVAVARERNFTRAAARLGLSQPALSHTIRKLEERLGLRLLTRTTRSVSLTPAGERLFDSVATRFDDIEQDLAVLTALREKPAGTVRISTIDFVADHVLWPKLAPLLREYPDIKVEITVDYAMTDITAGGFDAGVRLGGVVAKDMIAVPISPDVRFKVVGTPAYFAGRPRPARPEDLTEHVCINLRLPTYGGLYAWEFEKDGRETRVRVDGQLIFNGIVQVMNAALAGFGLAYLPDEMARPHVAAGSLVTVLDDHLPPWTGYQLFYPSRRQASPAFALLVEALRHRGGADSKRASAG